MNFETPLRRWRVIGCNSGKASGLVLLCLLLPMACSFPAFTFHDLEEGGGGNSSKGGSGSLSTLGGSSSFGGTGGISSAQLRETNCLNGIDDDQDGRTDCEDEECVGGGYRFVSSFDSEKGWKGPVAVWKGSVDDPKPSCDVSSGYGENLFGDTVADLVSEKLACSACSTCSCDKSKTNVEVSVGAYVDNPSVVGACLELAFTDSPWPLSPGCTPITLNASNKTPNLLVASAANSTYRMSWTAKSPKVTGGEVPSEAWDMPQSEPAKKYRSLGLVCGGDSAVGSSSTGERLCARMADRGRSFETCIYNERENQECPVGWKNSSFALYASDKVHVNWACNQCECQCTWDKSAVDAMVSRSGSDITITFDYGTCASGLSIPIGGCASGSLVKATQEGSVHSISVKMDRAALGAANSKTLGGDGSGEIVGDAPWTICCRDNSDVLLGAGGSGS